MKMKVRRKMKNRSRRYDIDLGLDVQKYAKYKMRLIKCV